MRVEPLDSEQLFRMLKAEPLDLCIRIWVRRRQPKRGLDLARTARAHLGDAAALHSVAL